jgi:hypothetical protein
MSEIYVLVVKESRAGGDLPFTRRQTDLEFPLRTNRRRNFRLGVWRGSVSKSGVDRDKMLGLVTLVGISVASWAGLAVLISHLLR